MERGSENQSETLDQNGIQNGTRIGTRIGIADGQRMKIGVVSIQLQLVGAKLNRSDIRFNRPTRSDHDSIIWLSTGGEGVR